MADGETLMAKLRNSAFFADVGPSDRNIGRLILTIVAGARRCSTAGLVVSATTSGSHRREAVTGRSVEARAQAAVRSSASSCCLLGRPPR